jgi:hypothetical protein
MDNHLKYFAELAISAQRIEKVKLGTGMVHHAETRHIGVAACKHKRSGSLSAGSSAHII